MTFRPPLPYSTPLTTSPNGHLPYDNHCISVSNLSCRVLSWQIRPSGLQSTRFVGVFRVELPVVEPSPLFRPCMATARPKSRRTPSAPDPSPLRTTTRIRRRRERSASHRSSQSTACGRNSPIASSTKLLRFCHLTQSFRLLVPIGPMSRCGTAMSVQRRSAAARWTRSSRSARELI